MKPNRKRFYSGLGPMIVACLPLAFAALLLLFGCDSVVSKPGGQEPTEPPPPPPPSGISVALSELTPDPAQGRVAMFDYSGPGLDEQLKVSVGDDVVGWTFIEPQIGVLLPLSHEGPTTVTFDFGEAKLATVELNVSAAPAIANPRRYVSNKLTELTTSAAGLVAIDAGYQAVHDALVDAQSGLADLSDEELNTLAVFVKQNIETVLAFGSNGAAGNFGAGLIRVRVFRCGASVCRGCHGRNLFRAGVGFGFCHRAAECHWRSGWPCGLYFVVP